MVMSCSSFFFRVSSYGNRGPSKQGTTHGGAGPGRCEWYHRRLRPARVSCVTAGPVVLIAMPPTHFQVPWCHGACLPCAP